MPKKASGGGGGVSVSANWIVVGGGSIIVKSSDGNLYSTAATVSGVSGKGGINYGYSVAYGKDDTGARRWVAVGGGGFIAKSSDGNIWSSAASVGGITSAGQGVSYGKDGSGNGLWVAVGYGSRIAKSSDGNDWSPAGNIGGITNYGYGIAYGKDASGNGLWVAVGQGSIIVKSSDGNIWSPAATVSGVSGKGGITSTGLGVAYGKDGAGAGLWVAVGDGGFIAKSSDGNIWSPAASVGGITYGIGVAYGKDASGAGLWVVVGSGSLIAKSSNGNDWTATASKGGINTQGRGVAYGKDASGAGLWVAVGDGVIAKSSNGNIWSPAGDKGGITSTVQGVAFKKNLNEPFFINTPGMTASSNYRGVSMSANGQYILICRSGSPSDVFLSTNYGASFTLISALSTTTNNWNCCSMTPNGQTMAVGGDPNGISVSINYGVDWSYKINTEKFVSLHISYNSLASVAIYYNASYGFWVYRISEITNSAGSITRIFPGYLPILFPQCSCISKSARYVVVLCYGLQSGIAISTFGGSSFSYYECVPGTSNADSNYYATTINYDETQIFIAVSTGPLMGIWTFNVFNNTISAAVKNATFSAITPTPNNIRDLAVSRDNLTIVVTTDTRTYYSFDGGIVWTDVYLGQLQCMAMSDSGNNIMATSTNNLIPQISRT
jgi:hypothetical protein